jgi:hypothetical protein
VARLQAVGHHSRQRLRHKSQHAIHQHSFHAQTVAISRKAVAINPRQQEQTAYTQPINQEVLHTTESYQPCILHLFRPFVPAKVQTKFQTTNNKREKVIAKNFHKILARFRNNAYLCGN